MRILLTDSPAYIKDKGRFSYGSRFGCIVPLPSKNRVKIYTPYIWSMGYASSILKRDTNHEIKTMDAQALALDDRQFINEVRKFKPDLVIAQLPTVSLTLMMEILKNLKKELGFKLGVSGLHVSGLPVDTMKENPFIDFVLPGEFELIMVDLTKAIEGKKKLKDVPNLYFRNGKKIQKTDFSKGPFLGVDFDSLPYPDREDMPPKYYHDMEFNGEPAVQMLTSRGCPHQCKFCCSTVLWPGGAMWRRDPKKVVDEMEFVKKKYKAKSVYFDDDIVLPSMLRGIIDEINERNLDIPWTFMGSINTKEELINEAVKAGCIGLKFGIETIEPNVLDGINKGWIQRNKVKEFAKMCNKKGLFTHGTFIVGLPNDTKAGVLRMLKFAMELELDNFQVYTLVPLPGSSVYEEAKKKGWIHKEGWIHFDGLWPIMDYPQLNNQELGELLNLWMRVRHNLLLKDRLRNPHKLIRNLLRTEPQMMKFKIKNFLLHRGEKATH